MLALTCGSYPVLDVNSQRPASWYRLGLLGEHVGVGNRKCTCEIEYQLSRRIRHPIMETLCST
jgi:hypothetical protein